MENINNANFTMNTISINGGGVYLSNFYLSNFCKIQIFLE